MHTTNLAHLASRTVPVRPAILVMPADHDAVLSSVAKADLYNNIKSAKPGDVIVSDAAVRIYHDIDGFWIASEDLASFYSPAGISTVVDDGEEDGEEEDDG